MIKDTDIFKIQSNNALPDKGKLLISEPFLQDVNFGRSVILLIDHGNEGTMGIIMNKQLPLLVNDVIEEFKYLNDIPLYRGGPVSTDTLFYLHTLPDIEGSIKIGEGTYLNGEFDSIKRYVLQGNPIEGKIRFFLGYSGWEAEQLKHEIKENTWLIGQADMDSLMNNPIKDMWKTSLGKLGKKYETWSRYPEIPSLN